MKHLPLYHAHYRHLLQDFGQYLTRIGYNENSQKTMPACLQEFFFRLEQQGIDRLEAITPQVIQAHHRYLRERPKHSGPGRLSNSMLYHHMYALKTFFNYQQACGQIKRNPFSVLRFPRGEHPPRQVLTLAQVKVLYQSCEHLRDRAMLSLFYGCGLRRSEAINLNTADIHFPSQLLYVRSGKGKKRRVVPMSQTVADDLRNYYRYERAGYVRESTPDATQAFVLHNYGGRMRDYWKRLKYLAAQAGLPHWVSLHTLRHSIATHLLESGLSLEQVRDFLGHRHLETTQIYTRIREEYLHDQL